MTTTELIDLLKKHEFGGATGKPREISFDFCGIFIPTPSITVDSTGDGLITDICLGLDTEKLKTNDVSLVVHGRLLNPNPYGECSLCGCLIDIRDGYNYCPNCGAKMDAR